ncbi:hypothetical protein BKA66DRAFT_568018 [Pyrenochaeta sp. MPI-SDFR-AT-0127]|nr:hypothetical protein BKA66DRAFT_568018 [Pyrenochaeta sp. MPI-SDFR-AT-0127]
MQPSTALTLLSSLALFSSTASALENAGAFTTWTGAGCDDSTSTGTRWQNIPSDTCNFLPGASFKLDFLLGPQQGPQFPRQCQFRAYAAAGCQGEYVTYLPRDYDQCKDITQRLSYQIVC